MPAAPPNSSNSPSATHRDLPPLPIAGFEGTPEEIERQWFENVYKGSGDSMAQLTVRAVVMGSLLGGILSLTNLYIGLKAGWLFGVSITACIMSYAIWTTLCKIANRLGFRLTPMTILENNCMQSTASAAGYSTGSTLVSAFSAYVLINNAQLPLAQMLMWIFFLALAGVTMAIPMKRQLINVDQLRFPTGTASAETLRALYSHGEKGMRAAKALLLAGVGAALSQFWTDGLRLVNAKLAPFSLGEIVTKFNEFVFGKAWMTRTVMLNWDPIFIAAGALSGVRVSTSMFIGGTLCWAVFVPILQHHGVITGERYRDIVQWTLWGGVSCMVTSGLLMFFMQWKSVMRAFRGLGAMFGKKTRAVSEMERIETPASWFVVGQLVAFIALAWLGYACFGMPLWQSAVAVALSFFLALVACRVTGETDTTPTGPMGKVTQLVFGVLSPGNMNVNLMAANITSSAAMSSADLLTDLRSGYLLGANPRKQFLAQFSGIFIGTLAMVLCFRALVPDASAIGNDQFPAPAAQTWRAVAEALSKGIAALEPVKVWSIVIGGIVGIVLPLVSLGVPKQHQKWVPSAAAVGLSWTFHWYYSFLFFIGGFLAWLFEKKHPKQSEEYTFPVASGVIAGGALMGIALIFWENGPQMARKFFGGG